MVRWARVRACSRTGDRRTTSCNLPGVPTEAEAKQLLGRPGYGSYDEAEEQQLAAVEGI